MRPWRAVTYSSETAVVNANTPGLVTPNKHTHEHRCLTLESRMRSAALDRFPSLCALLMLVTLLPLQADAGPPAAEFEAVEPVEELAELTMLALLLLTPPVLALLWLLLFQPSLVLLARCLGPCSRM